MWVLQEAVVTALKADAGVKALIGDPARVYDDHPVSAPVMPYVTMGNVSGAPFDTKTTIGREVDLTIDVWSDYRGRKQAELIMQAIYAALHRATLSVTGYSFVNGVFTGSDSFIDADGLTRHGVIRFRFTLDQT